MNWLVPFFNFSIGQYLGQDLQFPELTNGAVGGSSHLTIHHPQRLVQLFGNLEQILYYQDDLIHPS